MAVALPAYPDCDLATALAHDLDAAFEPFVIAYRDCVVRFVARMLGDTARAAVPLLVPCHRVVHEQRCCSGDYVFGAAAQEQLLTAEGLDAAAIDRLVSEGIRYIENEGYFCLPTCGDVISRLGSPGVSGLRSLAQARERGLRECDSCRPVAA